MEKQENNNYLFLEILFLIFLLIISSSSLAEENLDPFMLKMELIDSIEEEGSYDLIKENLEIGADPNSMVNYSGDALSSAARYKRDEDIIQLLLDYGAEVESVDLVEFILHSADLEIIELLVKSASNLNAKASASVIAGPMVSYNQGFINSRKNNKNYFEAEAAEKLLGEDYLYPLITATAADRKDVVELLLENGADISITDSKGRNAYHFAQNNDSSPLLVAELYKAKSKWEEENGKTLAAGADNSEKSSQVKISTENESKKIAVTTKLREAREKEQNKIIETVTKEETKFFSYTSGESFTRRMGGFDDALFSQNGEILVLIENYDQGKFNGKSKDYHKFSFYKLKNGIYRLTKEYDFNTYVDSMGVKYNVNKGMTLSPDGTLFAYLYENKIHIYDTNNFNLVSRISLPNLFSSNSYRASHFAISPGNNYLSILVTSQYGKIAYLDKWSLNSKKRIIEQKKINLIENNSMGDFSYNSIKYSPNGKYFIIGGVLSTGSVMEGNDKYADSVALVDAQTLEVINDFGAAAKDFNPQSNDYGLYFDKFQSYSFLHNYNNSQLYDVKNNQLRDIDFDSHPTFYRFGSVGGLIYQDFVVGLHRTHYFYEIILDEIDNLEQPVKGIMKKKEIHFKDIYDLSYLEQTDEWVLISKEGLHYIEATKKEDYEAEKKAAAAEKAEAENRDARLEEMIAVRQEKRKKAEALYKEGFELMNIGFVEQGYEKYLTAIKTDPISAANIPKSNQLYNLLGKIEVYQLANIFRTQQEAISNMGKWTKLGFIPVLENNKWLIKTVFKGTPAAEAEMEIGDHILLFDGEYLENSDDLFWYLQDKEPGEEIGLTFISVDAGGDYKEDTYFETTAGFELNNTAPALSSRLFDYSLLAIRSGNSSLAKMSIQKLKELPQKYPANYNDNLRKFNSDAVIVLESLLKAFNNSSDAYNYLLKALDGEKLHQNLQGYFKFPITAELLAPLFVDRAKLAYFTGVSKAELPEVEQWEKVKLDFIDLNGNLIPGEAADPYLE